MDTRRFRAAVCLLMILALAACANSDDDAEPEAAGDTGVINGAQIIGQEPIGPNAVELTIQTDALSAPTRVQVFLPAGYDTDTRRRWPVTYCLHGLGGDETNFNSILGDLIADFPSIVVAPDSGNAASYSDWYNDGAGGPPMYETYHIKQLIPLIDASFRTLGTRAGRGLCGVSLGGYGVMSYAARHPDLFATAVSIAGLLDNTAVDGLVGTGASLVEEASLNAIYGPYATQEVRWRGHNPVDLVDNLRDVDLQVRTFRGVPPAVDGEGTLISCVEEVVVFGTNVDFHQRLVAQGIPHVWKDYGAGCHEPPEFRLQFIDSLPGLIDAFAHPRPDPESFSYASIEPQFTIWGWRIDTDPARALEFLRMLGASRDGVTFVGSGQTTVTTPPWFRGVPAVDVASDNGVVETVTPDQDGRILFTVDLGPPHANQQYTPAAQLAGEDFPTTYFTTRAIRFRPSNQ